MWYSYIAKTRDGKSIKGTEEAKSQEELISKLREKKLFIISIEKLETDKGPAKFSFLRRKKRNNIKIFDLALFARNLSVSLSSGVTLLRSLEILSLQTDSKKLENILKRTSEFVKSGLSLSEAFSKYPDVFSSFWIGIIQVGESSGNLPFVMEKLADYLEIRIEYTRKIKTALLYPIIIISAAFIATVVFFKFILPKFIVIFEQFNMELPIITKITFAIAKFIERFILLIIFGIPLLVYFIINSFKNIKVRKFLDRIIFKLPLIGNLVFIGALERFTSSISLLLESGLGLVSTLEIAASSINNYFLEEAVLYVSNKVKNGSSLSGEFLKQEIFPPFISEMTKIGEETGTLPSVFDKISKYYRKEFVTKIERLVIAFEPIMIVFIGIIIGFLIISLFLPLFQLSTLGGGKELGM